MRLFFFYKSLYVIARPS